MEQQVLLILLDVTQHCGTAILPVRTKQFNSKRDVVYFNASSRLIEQLLVVLCKTYNVGTTPVSVTIPCQIHIPNHPFKTGQKLIVYDHQTSVLNIIVGDDDQNNNTFNIPGTVSNFMLLIKEETSLD